MALEKVASPDFKDKENQNTPTANNGFSNVGLESDQARKSKFGHSNKSAGGRICKVLPHLEGYDFGSDDSGSDILGKQIELEAGNEIQYRTCSWQKVCRSLA